MRNNRKAIVAAPDARLDVIECAFPEPNHNEVVVRITASALNFADLLMMQGRYQDTPPFPLTPGLEIAGIVETLGADVTGISIGDRV